MGITKTLGIKMKCILDFSNKEFRVQFINIISYFERLKMHLYFVQSEANFAITGGWNTWSEPFERFLCDFSSNVKQMHEASLWP